MPNKDIPMPFPYGPFGKTGMLQRFDPFGVYTGVPDDPKETPVQDADDL